jgi:AbrB family looped-hinge helix DNA binding protein
MSMSSATVTSKGQITLPASLRAEMDIAVGDEIVFFTTLDGRPSYRVRRKAARPLPPPRPWIDTPVSDEELDAAIRAASARRLGLGGSGR